MGVMVAGVLDVFEVFEGVAARTLNLCFLEKAPP